MPFKLNAMRSKRQTFIVALLVNIFFVLISTPWTFGFTYYGDSMMAWIIYYIIGFLLSWFVVWAFLWALKVLTNHMKEHLEGGHHHE